MRLIGFTALASACGWALVHCAALSGVDSLQKVDCVDLCADSAFGQDATVAASNGDAGLTDGADAAPPAEASTPQDAGAPADTGTPEAGTGEDAPFADAGTDATPPPFCASLSPQPTLCDDFDEGTSFSPQFPQTVQPSTGHLGIDQAYASSSPASMFALVDQGTSGSQAVAYVQHTFSGSSTSFEIAFDVLLDQYVAGAFGVVTSIALNPSAQNPHFATMAIASTGAEMEQAFTGADGGNQFVDSTLNPAPSAKQWTRVDITLSLPQHRLTVLVGGVSALTSETLDSSWPASGAFAIQLGLTYVASTSGPWSARIDNVVVNVQ